MGLWDGLGYSVGMAWAALHGKTVLRRVTKLLGLGLVTPLLYSSWATWIGYRLEKMVSHSTFLANHIALFGRDIANDDSSEQ